ncbi:hypothetical protein [Terrihabitans soli]|uniref:ATP-dependent DNA ligase n=1 Tax=Terrihabitans soli TaxID=708113 RepID=UPI001CA31B8F|nr:hypothetical protein [Terrihabitans soli]
MIKHDTLYTIDSTGNVRVWWMERDGAQYRSHSGIEGGEITCSAWTVAKPKNVGRSNETSAEKQAELEVVAEYKKKTDRKYHTDRNAVGGAKFYAPMLAYKYEDDLSDQFAFSQPKLDGIRCVSEPGKLSSRQGKPITGVPHIAEALAPIFEKYPDLVLDGELYNHDLKDDFNTIVSAVKKQNPTSEQLEAAKQIQYWLYDVPGFDIFSIRRRRLEAILQEFPNPALVYVPTTRVHDLEHLNILYGEYLADGFEGQMIRYDLPYENKRSRALLKRKEFVDVEFPVVRLEEGVGNWAGYAKAAICRLPDGREFGAGIKGNQEFCRGLLNGPVPAEATIRYFALTPDGIPRFPIATSFHEGKRDL